MKLVGSIVVGQSQKLILSMGTLLCKIYTKDLKSLTTLLYLVVAMMFVRMRLGSYSWIFHIRSYVNNYGFGFVSLTKILINPTYKYEFYVSNLYRCHDGGYLLIYLLTFSLVFIRLNYLRITVLISQVLKALLSSKLLVLVHVKSQAKYWFGYRTLVPRN